jgi:type I restriction enzyme S subunit
MSEYIRLDEACVLNMGQSPASSSYNKNGIGIPFFQGNADFGKIYPKVRMWCNDPTKIVEANTLLISVRAPIGALNFSNTKSCIGRGLAGLTPTEDFDLKYIYYYLKGKNAELNAKGTGSTFKAISKNALGETMIKKISKSKQVKIIETLDKVFSIICDRKYQLEQLDRLMRSRFVEMFGDPKSNPKGYAKKQLKETCRVITGNTPSRAVAEYYGDDIEWIKTDNIVEGIIYPTVATESLSEKGVSVGRTVGKDSILMACIAGSLSSIGRVCITDRKVAFNQQINAIEPNKYAPLFLYVMLQLSKEYLIEEINMALKGILSKSKLEEKMFIVPPVDLQQQFSVFVEEIEKSKFSIFSIQTFAHSGDNFSK